MTFDLRLNDANLMWTLETRKIKELKTTLNTNLDDLTGAYKMLVNHYNHEIRHCIQILSRITRNHVVLVGEQNFGKNAVVEGLAQLIVQNNVPDTLPKHLIALNMKALLAGTNHYDEFEDRLKLVFEKLESSIARYNFPCLIGTKTLAEYQQYIEQSSAFKNYFEPVLVKEPTKHEVTDSH